ncbi:DUF4386 domain-containing protein [Paenibacillus sp. N1-5-1-14]|uniref:DUF4386 domain-containing protein n=1 Tax=Paenibacillus radicibacter TaxID=2972488 RepID=UPI002158D143|nr:DUF4386 domain-containing protein [Paenibacillus radicibacter]MCR8642905.1 DUF4386 domain-containing protein [Paenibacillus radicibacter]
MINTEQQQFKQRKAAFIAGISLIIMTIASFVAYGYIHASLIVKGDASTTFHNILASSSLFKAEIFGWLVIFLCDIIVAWAFYIFLKPINKELSLLGAWFRLMYTAILGTVLFHLLEVMLLIERADALTESIQLQDQVLHQVEAFERIWSMGLIVFGLHLLIVGYIAIRTRTIPRIISILLLLAGAGYMIVHLSSTFIPQYEGVISLINYIFMAPMIAGELGLGLWMLVKGGKAAS